MTDIRRIGLTVVYEPKSNTSAQVDIILVHGLFGHPYKTWATEKSEGAESEGSWRKGTRDALSRGHVFWPRDLLPRLFPAARIMTWGYDVDINHLISATSKATIYQHSETLLGDIVGCRNSVSADTRPLIFIAHSLGGIIVKDALQISAHEQTHLREIVSATMGVIFLGTPHHGSKIASLGKIAFQILSGLLQHPNTAILRGLETRSEVLERISRSFGQLLASGRIRVHSFREELDTHGIMVVDSFSSTIGYFHETSSSLHANHRDMAKFSSIFDEKFERLVSVLRQWMSISIHEQVTAKSSLNTNHADEQMEFPDGLIFDEEYSDCLHSLDLREARKRIVEVDRVYNNTFDWIYGQRVEFERWLRGIIPNPIFWIQGKPGSGKSTAMKFAITDPRTKTLLNEYSKSHWIIAGYFFHDRGSIIQKSVKGLVGELLYQFLKQRKTLFTHVQPIFTGLKLQDEWTMQGLEDALKSIESNITIETNLCIFVDALDENHEDHKLLLGTLNMLRDLTSNKLLRLRLCIAGRPENVFKDAFRSCPGFSIQNYTALDIEKYTKGRLLNETKSEMTTQGKVGLQELITEIVKRAEGVFLWVRLVVDEMVEGLCEGDTLNELKDLLSTIPSELEALYIRALHRNRRSSKRAASKHRYEAYIMLQIASKAYEPMSLFEFLSATQYLTKGLEADEDLMRQSTDQMERRLDSRSYGLLEVVKPNYQPNDERHAVAIYEGSSNIKADPLLMHNAVVQVIHQTVKEFVLSGKGQFAIRGNSSKSLPEVNGHVLILQFLLSLLNNFGQSSSETVVRMEVFRRIIQYAQAVEQDENLLVADKIESALSVLPLNSRENALEQYITGQDNIPQIVAPAGKKFRGPIQLLLFYILSELPNSTRDLMIRIGQEIEEDDAIYVLATALMVEQSNLIKRKRRPCLIKDILLESSLRETLLRVQGSAEKLVKDTLEVSSFKLTDFPGKYTPPPTGGKEFNW